MEDDPTPAVLDPPRFGEGRPQLEGLVERRQRLEELRDERRTARVTGGGRVQARREAQGDPGGAVALRGRGLRAGAGEQRAGEQGDEQGGPAQHRPEYTGDTRLGPCGRVPGAPAGAHGAGQEMRPRRPHRRGNDV